MLQTTIHSLWSRCSSYKCEVKVWFKIERAKWKRVSRYMKRRNMAIETGKRTKNNVYVKIDFHEMEEDENLVRILRKINAKVKLDVTNWYYRATGGDETLMQHLMELSLVYVPEEVDHVIFEIMGPEKVLVVNQIQ